MSEDERLAKAAPALLEACRAAFEIVTTQITDGTVLWVNPPYQRSFVHETLAERLVSVIEEATGILNCEAEDWGGVMKNLSVKRKLQLTLELIVEAKLDPVSIIVDRYSHVSLHVGTEALIRVYHQFQVPRTCVKAEVCDDYIHVSFLVNEIKLTGLVKKDEATAFLQINQQQLPAPRAKRLAGPKVARIGS